MIMIRTFLIAIPLLAFAAVAVCNGQTPTNSAARKTAASNQSASAVKSTPAYAELLLRRTELESVLEDLLVSYTEEFPKVKETRFELSLIQRDLTKILSQDDPARLTLALGKLMVRRAALETDLWSLQNKYGPDHPDVKRAKRRVSSFEKAIAEILP